MLREKANTWASALASQPWRLIAALSALMLWPTLLNNGPYYFGDSPGYVNGGRLALAFAWDHFTGLFSNGAAEAGSASASAGVPANVSGVRSVAFSVFAGLTSAPGNSMLLMCLIQSALTAFCVVTLLDVIGLRARPLWFVGIGIIAAIVTPVSWFVVLAMPDIFAGLAIVAITLLTAAPGKLSRIAKVIFGGIIAFAVCNHLSHPPILGLLVACAAAVLAIRFGRAKWKQAVVIYSWIAVPALIGLCLTVVLNAVGFQQPSVTGKRYPIVLASAIQAGPAYWYLQKACETENYTVCEVYQALPMPDTSGEFLFGVNGLRQRATPEQMELIRQEETAILKNAYRAYPVTTILSALKRASYQFVRVGLDDHRFGNRLITQPDGSVRASETYEPRAWFKTTVRCLYLIEIGVCLAFLVAAFTQFRRTLTDTETTILLMLILGVIINAGICGAMSAVTDRYQGRVIWTLMVATIGVAAQVHSRRRVPDKVSA
jgi:hypothetical protein